LEGLVFFLLLQLHLYDEESYDLHLDKRILLPIQTTHVRNQDVIRNIYLKDISLKHGV